jgi:hypothetical protein
MQAAELKFWNPPSKANVHLGDETSRIQRDFSWKEGAVGRILVENSRIEPLNPVGTGSTPSQISFSQEWDDVEVVPTIRGVRFMGSFDLQNRTHIGAMNLLALVGRVTLCAPLGWHENGAHGVARPTSLRFMERGKTQTWRVTGDE